MSIAKERMRALYERVCDEPRRPVRRRLAASLRALAARLAPPAPESAGEVGAAAERPLPA